MKRSISTALIVFFFVNLYSQEDSSYKQLDEVVVTGQYRPQSLRNSVYQIRVINNQRITLSGATNVQQVMFNQPGVRFFNDNTLGTSNIELLGMSGRNVKILLDGVPLLDRGDTRESLNQIDISTIDRIEIVEGPMSVIYGSDALAGVINLITKKQGRQKFSLNARAQEETAGSEYHPFSYRGVHYQSVNASWDKNSWHSTLGFTHNDMNGFGGDQYGRQKTWKPKEQWLGHFRAGYRSGRFNTYYRLDGLDEVIISKGRINFNTYKSIDQRYYSNRFTHQLQNEWKLNERVQLTNVLAYTDYERRTETVRHDFTTGHEELTTGSGEQDVARLDGFTFRPILRYHLSEKIIVQPGIDINWEKAGGQRIEGNPSITDYGLFISSEISATSKINFRPGIRFIKNSVYDAPPVIPSINTRIKLGGSLDLRLAYAYGFRAPALRELYFSFFDANHNIEGNPDLKAEHSNSYTGSLTWNGSSAKQAGLMATLSGFYNHFSNQIEIAQADPNSNLYTYLNINKFKTAGGTLEARVAGRDISADLAFSYVGRYNSLSEDKMFEDQDLPQFVWTPELNANLIYNLSKTRTTLALLYKYSGDRPGYRVYYNAASGKEEAALTKIENFHWADFTVTQSVLEHFIVRAGVKNIFDIGSLDNSLSVSGSTHSSGETVPLSYGRSYFVGLSFKLEK